MRIQTGSSNVTLYFENGERIYPCRCGETHRGDYAAYDYMHCECHHDEVVMVLDGTPEGLCLCVDCGKVIAVSYARLDD